MNTPILGSPIEKFTRLTFTHIIQRLSSYLAENSFSISEVAALHLVSKHQSMSVQDLAQQLNLSVSATSRLVTGLVKKRLLLRKNDVKDARVKMLTCSAKGNQLLDQMSLARVSAIHDVIQTLPSEIPRQILAAISLYGKE